MTPKEKAEELVGKFYNKQTNVNQWGISDIQREFALIAVDEILNMKIIRKDELLDDYWEEVKQEIEKQ